MTDRPVPDLTTRQKLGLKHFSRPMHPQRLNQEIDWVNLDVDSLQEVAQVFKLHGLEGGPPSALLASINFLLFCKTKEIGRLQEAITRQKEAVILARKDEDPQAISTSLHNLVCFQACKFESTNCAEDLDSAISAAETAISCAKMSKADVPSLEADMSKLQAQKSKIQEVKPPSVLHTETVGVVNSDTLRLLVRDKEVINPFLEGDSSLLLQKLREYLFDGPSVIPYGSERLEVVDTYGLAQMMFLNRELDAGRGDSAHSKDTIEVFRTVVEELRHGGELRPKIFYQGFLAMALYHNSGMLVNYDLKIMDESKLLLRELIDTPNLETYSAAEQFAHHPFIVALALERGGQVGDQFIKLLKSADEFTLSRVKYIGTLGVLMQRRYAKTRQLTDLEESVRLLESWYNSIEKESSDLEKGVVLVKGYIGLFRALGADETPLRQAAALADELLRYPFPARMRDSLLLHRCCCCLMQWRNSGHTSFLDAAMEFGEFLQANMSYDRGDGPVLLGYLADIYIDRADLHLHPMDIDKAVRAATEALDLADILSTSPGMITRNDVLIAQSRARSELARCLVHRFRFHRDTNLLKEAIRLLEGAIEISDVLGDQDPNKAIHRGDLAAVSCRLFLRNGDGQHLTESIRWCQGAIQSASKNPVLRRSLKGQLANSLGMRCAHKFLPSDQRASMRLAREALSRGEAACLFVYLYIKKHNENMHDDSLLDEAVELARQGLERGQDFGNLKLMAPFAADFGQYTCAQAILLRMHDRGETWSDNATDAKVALDCLLQCSRSTSLDSLLIIKASKYMSDPIFTSSGNLDFADLASITKKAVHMLHVFTSRALPREDIQYLLSECSGLPAAAAASALQLKQSAFEVLKLLEASRGILTTYLLATRTDIWGTQGTDGELMGTLKSKLALLESVNASRSTDSFTTGHKWPADMAYKLNQEVNSILEKLGVEGQESLLGLPDEVETTRRLQQALMDEGRQGAVVVMNAHFRCDCLIIRDTIEAFHLPRLSIDDVKYAVKMLKLAQAPSTPVSTQQFIWVDILAWLWEVAVKPVLDHLGYIITPSELEDWPRVWWIPIGELSQLPFHAAGYHEPGLPTSTMDRVVSSYTSSVKALLYTQEIAVTQKKKHEDKSSASSNPHVVLASMSTTPHLDSLPNVQDEMARIMTVVASSANVTELEQPTKEDVIRALKSCDIFHFAGHGASYFDNPDRGCLFVQDWKSNALTVKDILGLKMQERGPLLAYLSACSTGANITVNLADEVIHLVTAFQLAGFQHIIGSFWSVSDYSSSILVEGVYGRLSGRLEQSVDVALALHKAVRNLRDSPASASQRVDDSAESDPEEIQMSQESEIVQFLMEHNLFAARRLGRSGQRIARDPLLSSIRPVVKKIGKSNPMVWAPYFHTGI